MQHNTLSSILTQLEPLHKYDVSFYDWHWTADMADTLRTAWAYQQPSRVSVVMSVLTDEQLGLMLRMGPVIHGLMIDRLDVRAYTHVAAVWPWEMLVLQDSAPQDVRSLLTLPHPGTYGGGWAPGFMTDSSWAVHVNGVRHNYTHTYTGRPYAGAQHNAEYGVSLTCKENSVTLTCHSLCYTAYDGPHHHMGVLVNYSSPQVNPRPTACNTSSCVPLCTCRTRQPSS